MNSKMYSMAERLGDLNEKGEVKSYTANFKGTIKSLEIESGCAVWINQTKDDTLTIDLFISRLAEYKFPTACENAKKKFDKFFNHNTTHDFNWESTPKDRDPYTRYYVDVSNKSVQEILTIAKQLTKFIYSYAASD